MDRLLHWILEAAPVWWLGPPMVACARLAVESLLYRTGRFLGLWERIAEHDEEMDRAEEKLEQIYGYESRYEADPDELLFVMEREDVSSPLMACLPVWILVLLSAAVSLWVTIEFWMFLHRQPGDYPVLASSGVLSALALTAAQLVTVDLVFGLRGLFEEDAAVGLGTTAVACTVLGTAYVLAPVGMHLYWATLGCSSLVMGFLFDPGMLKIRWLTHLL